jgi:hypothetical protein
MIVSLSLNLSKIEKSWLKKSTKGDSFLPLTVFISDKPNEYGQTVSAILEQSKEERNAEKPRTYLGNGNTIYDENANNNSDAEESLVDGLSF